MKSLFLPLFLGVATLAYGQMGWVMPEVHVGNQRTIGQISGLGVIEQGCSSALFIYPEGRFSSGWQEGNFGLGYRTIKGGVVLGGNAFYDVRHTRLGHTYHQIGIGADAYTRCLDFRINGYLPISRTRGAAIAEGVAQLNLPNISILGGAVQEAPLYGVDGEAGIRFCLGRCACLRLYGGGYYFHRNGFETLCGPKGRVELGVYDLLVRGSQMTVGVEGFTDDIYAGQVAGVFRWEIPFCPGRRRSRNPCTDCCLKLYERIERLPMTVRRRGSGSGCDGPAFYKGREISEAFVINATQDIVALVPTFPENALIIVDGSAGDFVITDDINMQVGQTLVGGGATLTVTNPNCGVEAPLTLPGTRGTIIRNDDLGNVINIMANGTVQNLNITGGVVGVSGGFQGGMLVPGAPDMMVFDSRFEMLNLAPNAGFLSSIAMFNGSNRAIVMNNEFVIDHDPSFSHFIIGLSGSDEVVISDNQMDVMVAAGTAISGGGLRTQILRNTMNLGESTGMFVGIIDGLIEGNTILDAGGNGTMRHGGTTGTRIVNNRLESSPNAVVHTVYFRGFNDDDIFENNRVTAFGNSSGVTVDSSTNVTVRNNIIRTFGDEMVGFGGEGVFLDSGSVNTTVQNNDIATTGVGAEGIRARQATIANFIDNTIVTSGMTSAGINLESILDQISGSGNDITTAATGSPAIRIGAGTNFTFSANDLRAPMDDGLNASSVTNFLFNNNRFSMIGVDVVQVTVSTILAGSSGNTFDGTGGGSLCNDGGGNTGSIDFSTPAATCP